MTPLARLELIDATEGHPKRAARRLGAAALTSAALGPVTFSSEQEHGRQDPAAVSQDVLREGQAIVESDGAAARTGATHREREVLDLMVARRTDRDGAATLYISERTVSKHVSRILHKLHAVSRGDAAVRAVRLGRA